MTQITEEMIRLETVKRVAEFMLTAARTAPKEVKIAFGIPLSVSAKSPFFDR
jgi:uncharacterized ferredoxin-like protein